MRAWEFQCSDLPFPFKGLQSRAWFAVTLNERVTAWFGVSDSLLLGDQRFWATGCYLIHSLEIKVTFIHEAQTLLDDLLKQRGRRQDLAWEDLISGLRCLLLPIPDWLGQFLALLMENFLMCKMEILIPALEICKPKTGQLAQQLFINYQVIIWKLVVNITLLHLRGSRGSYLPNCPHLVVWGLWSWCHFCNLYSYLAKNYTLSYQVFHWYFVWYFVLWQS